MVELPQTTSPTVEAIDRHYEQHQQAEHPQRLTARLLGLPCDRQGWYAFRWAVEPDQFPGRILRSNFAREGNIQELLAALRDIGATVHNSDPQTYEPFDFTALDGHYRQKPAGTVTGIIEAPKAVHLLYADQKNGKAFAQIKKHGLAIAFPDRVVTIQLGMHVMGLHRAFYLVRNKDTDELHAERIKYDADHAIALMAKAERIRDANVPPARIADDPANFACRFCNAAEVCHRNQFALRNCRTCLHSAPGSGGTWHCDRHDRDLTVADQKAGCPNHLYLPGLVPGEQLDADERAETVSYALADGSEWTDGGKEVLK